MFVKSFLCLIDNYRFSFSTLHMLLITKIILFLTVLFYLLVLSVSHVLSGGFFGGKIVINPKLKMLSNNSNDNYLPV